MNSLHTSPRVTLPGAGALKSPFAIIWMFTGIVLCLLLLADFSLGVLSSVRAYVGGESLWSKAEKDAVFHLQKYATSGDLEDLRAFRAEIAIPLGDHAARLEMDQPHPNLPRVRQSFVRGGNHPDDVDGMIDLYLRFERMAFMQRAIRAWDTADAYIVQLDAAAVGLERQMQPPQPDPDKVKSLVRRIAVINDNLTPIENEFVAALSDASRTAYRWLQAIMLAACPSLVLLGIWLSRRILQQCERANDRVSHIAFHDELTALPNRMMLKQYLDQTLSRHRRTKTRLAILLMDLDRFKVINDSLGREAGDGLLRQVAERLRDQARQGDTVARVGGDEFAVIIESQSDLADVSACMQRLMGHLSAPYALGTQECQVTLSIGISVFPTDGSDSQQLLKAADAAMDRAKETCGTSYQFYLPSMNVHTVERLELESDLGHALERGEFLLHYQPIVDVASGLITGVEALLRWQHPVRGLVPPLEFIPLAEETGLIVAIGEWVLATACARNRAWQVQGLTDLRVAVNLSARQFADPLFLPRLKQIVRDSGLHPSSLELEITESMVMARGECAVTVLQQLKSLGVQLAIDDFGTGYSSLAYLRRFPIDTLKVDRSFIRDIPGN